MGLVNSMVNQIGREIGKDIYRGIKSESSDNYSLRSEISNFKLSPYDKVTIRNLANLVEKSENIDSRGFNDWETCFLDLDEKIDFCKGHLESSFLPKLEELDKINSANYAVAKVRHKIFVSKKIEDVKSEIKKHEDSNVLVPISLSFVGLNSIVYKTDWWLIHIPFVLFSLFWIYYRGIKGGVIGAIYFGFFIYGLVLLASFLRIWKESKRIENLKGEYLPNLENYYSSNFK